MKPVVFMASPAMACGIHAGAMALASAQQSAALERALARHLPIGNHHHLPTPWYGAGPADWPPHHLPRNQLRAPGMAIGNRTAACAYSA
jgi:hypothetical protein